MANNFISLSRGFTLTTFAKMLSKKLGVDPAKMQKYLWGDNFWDAEARKWRDTNVSPTGKKLQRGFCQFILSPIYKLLHSSLAEDKKETLARCLQQLSIELKGEEKKLQAGKDLMKCVMPKFLPLAKALLEMMVTHLPSPAVAQKYRVQNLYEGPMDDECAVAIRQCDREGPLMIYISKMVPNPDQSGRFLAFGRVFSGVARPGQKVKSYYNPQNYNS